MEGWGSTKTERRKDAGGKHSPKEIEDLLAIQGGRCIYCNVRFTKRVPATKDHLLAVRQGGADWSFNLMMACRSCNSRRCDIPFRTYCKLLSPTQNKRILRHISNRILALDFEGLNAKAFILFMRGLAAHEPQHWRYKDVQSRRALARRNAAQNRLLPLSIVWEVFRTKQTILRTELRTETRKLKQEIKRVQAKNAAIDDKL